MNAYEYHKFKEKQKQEDYLDEAYDRMRDEILDECDKFWEPFRDGTN